jgi:hypothetical protein
MGMREFRDHTGPLYVPKKGHVLDRDAGEVRHSEMQESRDADAAAGVSMWPLSGVALDEETIGAN